jgi:hypothetical protein
MSQEMAAVFTVVISGLGLVIAFLTFRVVVIYTDETRKMQKAVSRQGEELSRQIKLSIMPAFTIEFVERQGIKNHGMLPQEALYDLVLHNVGNGIALNIKFDPLVVNNDPDILNEKFSDGELIFKWVPSLRPSASERLNSIPSLKDNSHAVDLMRWMQIYSATGKSFDFNLRFRDIEGNWYSQALKLTRNECTPETVRELGKSEGNINADISTEIMSASNDSS